MTHLSEHRGTFWCKSEHYPTIAAYHAAMGDTPMCLAEATRQANAHYQAHGLRTVVFQDRPGASITSFWCDENSPAFAALCEHDILWSSSTGHY